LSTVPELPDTDVHDQIDDFPACENSRTTGPWAATLEEVDGRRVCWPCREDLEAAAAAASNGSAPEHGPLSGALSEAGDALERARVDLIQRIREGIPDHEYVPGADGWLLRGKRYLVVAAAGMGKSLDWLIVAVETVCAGGTVAMVDVENGADEYARRLELIVGDDQDLGAPAPSACAITNTRR
jgi:hypothetical protein